MNFKMHKIVCLFFLKKKICVPFLTHYPKHTYFYLALQESEQAHDFGIFRQCVKSFLIVPWEFFHIFLSSAYFFPKSTFSNNSFRNAIGVSNSLDPDQARRFVGPDLGPNCLQNYQQLTLGDKELYIYTSYLVKPQVVYLA